MEGVNEIITARSKRRLWMTLDKKLQLTPSAKNLKQKIRFGDVFKQHQTKTLCTETRAKEVKLIKSRMHQVRDDT